MCNARGLEVCKSHQTVSEVEETAGLRGWEDGEVVESRRMWQSVLGAGEIRGEQETMGVKSKL